MKSFRFILFSTALLPLTMLFFIDAIAKNRYIGISPNISSGFFFQKDTTKKPPPILENLKKIKPTDSSKLGATIKNETSKIEDGVKKAVQKGEKDTKKTIDKILGFFKFRSNNNDRIRKIINDRLKDSISNTQILSSTIAKLSDTTNQNIDSLFKIINALKGEIGYVALSTQKRDSIAKVLDSILKLPKIPIGSNNTPPTDLEKFAVQLQHIAEKESNKNQQKDKDSIINQLHKIISDKSNVYTHEKVVENTKTKLVTSYKLSVSPVSKVIFFRKLNSRNYLPPQKNLDFITNVIITNTLLLNDITGEVKQHSLMSQDPLLRSYNQSLTGKIILNIEIHQPTSKSWIFQRNAFTRSAVAGSLIPFLTTSGYKEFAGLSLDFSSIDAKKISPDSLVEFKRNTIGLINNIADTIPPGKVLYVCLPPYPDKNFIDIDLVSKKAIFIISFLQAEKGLSQPNDPLTGLAESDRSITSSFATYANLFKAPHNRYVIGLPYKGTLWRLENATKPDILIEQPRYSDIIFSFANPGSETFKGLKSEGALTQEVYSNKFINLVNGANRVASQIWFNDATTFSKKYDFINENKLGGVALDELGDDSTRPELWDMLFYKFGKIDTLDKKVDSLVADTIAPATLFEKIKFRLQLYHYILQNPCAVCFENMRDTTLRTNFLLMLRKLGVEEQVLVSKLKLKGTSSDFGKLNISGVFANSFEYIQEELTFIFLVLSLVFGLTSALLLGLNIWKIKTVGDEWAYKKPIWIALIVLLFLTIITTMGYFFVNNDIEYFGATSRLQKIRKELKKNAAHNKNKASGNQIDSTVLYQAIIDSLKQKLDSSESIEYALMSGLDTNRNNLLQKRIEESIYNSCTPDDSSENNCINMPFYTLMLIAMGGTLFGYLITRFLVIPIIKRETPFARKKLMP